MHELGIVLEVVKQVEEIARVNNLAKIDTLVLQIGELSSIVPYYIEELYPIAVEDSFLRDTLLRIETIPGIGECSSCGLSYHVKDSDYKCPDCKGSEWTVITGTEFMIKEILIESSGCQS
ncbi:hydrogenase maturation nickel metallochaperone HypA/HybF [Vallitalea okinawensis]|uniref:hydrogenase maturation nickel metallochaperone HypA/HybF n=1 Tax=Vallitalea okinawensis TaxID=2078660 RepID=UPI000CFC5546|nr:hydrogenase maturation nickel metallochaperone HypA [Vallitalea okinawensis]